MNGEEVPEEMFFDALSEVEDDGHEMIKQTSKEEELTLPPVRAAWWEPAARVLSCWGNGAPSNDPQQDGEKNNSGSSSSSSSQNHPPSRKRSDAPLPAPTAVSSREAQRQRLHQEALMEGRRFYETLLAAKRRDGTIAPPSPPGGRIGVFYDESIAELRVFYEESIAELRRSNNGSSQQQQTQPDTFVPTVLERCGSDSFVAFVIGAGLDNPSFTPNPDCVPGNRVHDRFVQACQNLSDSTSLAIVFHGTNERNIPAILKNGLDPKKRSGLAYGPGEYFSTDPGTSTTYCHRYVYASPPSTAPTPPPTNTTPHFARSTSGARFPGRKMLVFLVVRPQLQQDAQSATGRPAAALSCPDDYIVVPTMEHQLPLGVLEYGKVEETTVERANAMRTKLQQLHDQVREMELNTARVKASIIQKIICDVSFWFRQPSTLDSALCMIGRR